MRDDETRKCAKKKMAKRFEGAQTPLRYVGQSPGVDGDGKYIPVIPPDLRPLVPLDGGRFATSDLNDLLPPRD